MKDQFFQQGQHFQTFETESGPIKVPVSYRDVISMWVHFSAPIHKVQAILPSNRLKPISIGNGKALYGIVCFEYGDSDVGPYNEVGFGIPCRFDPKINIPILPALFDRFFSVGFYVHYLPVTTKIAYDFGVDIYGLPKFISQIEYEETANWRRCVLQADSKEILTLEVANTDQDLKSDTYNFHIFSVKDKLLLKTLVQSFGPFKASRKSDSARLHLGNHQISEELRALQLDTKPLKTIIYPNTKNILHPPSNRYTL
jgi:hypothetical protein